MGKGRLNRITIPGKGYVTIEANTNRTDIVGKLLSKIQVWNSAGTLITEYNFTYNLNNQRHYLTKITQKVDNRYINYREFSYYPGLPAQNSKSQDLWGYYNGAVNSNLFPYTVGFNDGLTLKFTGFANRNPSTNAVAGTINMIKYPTGGYTKFEFENNRAKTSTGNITQQTGNLNQTVVGQKESQPFNVITEILKATITFSIHPMGYYLPEISLWNTDNIQLIKRWGYDNLPSNCTPVQNSDGSQKYSFTEQINLSQGNYKWIIKILKDDYVPPGIQIQPASVNYTYFTQSEPSANGELCGGIRIKTISNYDNGDVLLNQTKYSYLTSQGICSGIMTPKPEFVKQMCIGIPLSPVLAAYLFVREIFETNLNRYNGVPVEYSEVTEEQTDATNNIQRTVYNYSTAGLWRQSYIIAEQYDPFSATFIPYSLNDYGRGLLLKKTDYKLTNGVFTAVKEENNDFNIVETNVPRFRAIAFRKYLNPEGPNSNLRLKYQYGNYDIVSGKVYLTKNTIKETADNGGTIITVTNYEYGNSEFVQPTRVTQEDSRNKSLQTIYSYCYDLPDNIYVAMKNANIIKTPIIITKKTDNAQTEQVKNNFSFFTENGIIKLASVTRKIKTGEEYTEVIIDNYDKKGNILQFHKPGETYTLDISYIWGYDSTYAIAEVKNAKYSDVFHTSFEDSDGVNDAFSKTGSKTRKTNYSKTISGISNGAYILSFWKRTGAVWTMQTTQVNVSNRQYTISLAATTTNPIDEVRFYPSGALMNTYTYDPLIGITSETDPNGRTIYYEYDGFGRLRYIRDNEKNIIQEYKYHYKE
ncbi:MAG: hypothetical protein GYA16_00310 [Spirochaetes bacterium]|nr:hypothetical protein [Spirochaetota bacterium]